MCVCVCARALDTAVLRFAWNCVHSVHSAIAAILYRDTSSIALCRQLPQPPLHGISFSRSLARSSLRQLHFVTAEGLERPVVKPTDRSADLSSTAMHALNTRPTALTVASYANVELQLPDDCCSTGSRMRCEAGVLHEETSFLTRPIMVGHDSRANVSAACG